MCLFSLQGKGVTQQITLNFYNVSTDELGNSVNITIYPLGPVTPLAPGIEVTVFRLS